MIKNIWIAILYKRGNRHKSISNTDKSEFLNDLLAMEFDYDLDRDKDPCKKYHKVRIFSGLIDDETLEIEIKDTISMELRKITSLEDFLK